MTERDNQICGIIMPISPVEGYSASHWLDVREIVQDAIKMANMDATVVSIADEIKTIHKTIVQNISNCPMIVCDVSSRNPNVMFELGMRMAFDKPVVIIKDEVTPYSFDTGLVEHIAYPKDLRFADIIKFKETLRSKILATMKAAKEADYSPFLKQFGTFKIAKLDEQEVSSQDFVLSELKEMKNIMQSLAAPIRRDRLDVERFANYVSFFVPHSEKAEENLIDEINDLKIAVITERNKKGDFKINLMSDLPPRLYNSLFLVVNKYGGGVIQGTGS